MVEELNIINLNTGLSLLFNMDNADYLLYEGSIDWGEINTTHNTYAYSSLLGEYPTNTIIGTRDITISGWIIGKTEEEIFQKKQKLSKFLNPLHTLRIKHDNYGIDGLPSTNVKFSSTYKENNDKMCKFLIQFLCPFPLFTNNDDLSISMVDITPMWKFPWIIPEKGYVLSSMKNTRFQAIVNDGSIDVGLRLTLEANGTVNNPTLISITTQESMKLNKILHAGEVVEISTQAKRYVTGAIDGVKENYLDYFDYDNTWMQLIVGTNLLTVKTYDDEGNEDDTYRNLNVTLYYNPCILNLKEE